jgi:hypothetical protein
MKRVFIAGAVYFLILFAFGFILGTIRVTLIAPRFGVLTATLAEVPVMLAAAYFVCRWVIRRWNVSHRSSVRWAMVVLFILLLFLFETLFGAMLFGRSLTDQLTALATPAGWVGLCAQIIAALLPLLVWRTEVA